VRDSRGLEGEGGIRGERGTGVQRCGRQNEEEEEEEAEDEEEEEEEEESLGGGGGGGGRFIQS